MLACSTAFSAGRAFALSIKFRVLPALCFEFYCLSYRTALLTTLRSKSLTRVNGLLSKLVPRLLRKKSSSFAASVIRPHGIFLEGSKVLNWRRDFWKQDKRFRISLSVAYHQLSDRILLEGSKVLNWRRDFWEKQKDKWFWISLPPVDTDVKVSVSLFFKKGAQVGGRTWDLFDFRLFSLTSSALDHSATAPP